MTNELWFCSSKPLDEDAELEKLENEHQEWIERSSKIARDLYPIGKPFDDDLINEIEYEVFNRGGKIFILS